MRYRALRIVATVYRVIGWIVIVVGVLSSCVVAALAATGPMARSDIGIIVGLVMGLVMGITLLATAEGIEVFLDIEENTREIARRIGELPGVAASSPGAPE